MSDEWNKGSSSTGPQRSDEVQQGPFARQQALRQEREAAARAARERDQRLQDQMIRDAIWTASQSAGTDTSRIFGPPSSRRRGGGAVLAIAALGAAVRHFRKQERDPDLSEPGHGGSAAAAAFRHESTWGAGAHACAHAHAQ